MTTVLHNIGLLVTNVDDGELTDAHVVIDDGRVVSVGTGSTPAADDAVDVGGRCVIPGFVDPHTHLVFAGDRTAEFLARMDGQPYAAGGILTTVEATRATSDDELAQLVAHRVQESTRAGITTIETKSGYGLTLEDEKRSLQIAKQFTQDTTFLGAHVVPPEFVGRPDEYVAHVVTDMIPAVADLAMWVDAFCEEGAFTVDQCREVLTAGRAAGLGLRLHANQLGPGLGVRLAVEMGCASVDHCTFIDDSDIEALAGSDTIATFLPATEFSTKQPYPNVRRVLDAGARVALATNTNPGSSFTNSMAFCIALAVRDMGMTAKEALFAATAGGAMSLRRPDRGHIGIDGRADLVVLDAPHYSHLVYRPGVPLVAMTIVEGELLWHDTALMPTS